jgi:hypothetical protein
MSELERENFDLKMRLYYLNNEKQRENQLEDETDKVVNLLSQRDLTYEQLRAANEEAYNRLNELQSENMILKSKQDANNSSYENLLLKNQRLGSLQLEENLKRERQAAQAIAKHDAALISNYEKEIERLKDTHHADTLLISECSERVSELMKMIEDKNKELERQQQSLIAAQQHVEVLTDRISKQEILLIKNEQSLKTNAIASMSRALGHQHHHPPPPPPPPPSHFSSSSSPSSSWGYQTERNPSYPAVHFGHSQRQQHSQSPFPENHSHSQQREPMMSTFQPAPKLGAPFFAESIDSPPNSRSQSHPHSSPSRDRSAEPYPQQQHQHQQHTHHNLPPVGSHHLHQSFPLRKDQLPKDHSSSTSRSGPYPPSTSFSSSPFSSTSTTANTSPSRHRQSSPSRRPNDNQSSSQDDSRETDPDPIFATNKLKSVLYRELESTKLQLQSLTEENGVLKETLEKNKQLIENQEKTLERVRTSAEEITLLEAEEIARLEVEMEHLKAEKDKWMSLCHRHETQLELLKQELYARDKEESANPTNGLTTDHRASTARGGGGLENGNGSPLFKYRLSSSFTPAASTSATATASAKTKTGSAFSRSWNSSGKSADLQSSSSQPESPVIEMYR